MTYNANAIIQMQLLKIPPSNNCAIVSSRSSLSRQTHNSTIAASAANAFASQASKTCELKDKVEEIGLKFPLSAKAPLHIEKIDINTYATAAKVARSWRKIAINKGENAEEPRAQKQFESCFSVCGLIAYWLSRRNQIAYVCKDEEDNYQGIMLITLTPKSVYINTLVTNPINIRSTINDTETKKVTGAGTCLLQKAEQIAIAEKKSDVTLRPYASAVEFYKKNGFSHYEDKMRKTVEKIDSFSSSHLAA